MIDIDFSCFSDYAEELERIGGNLKTVFGKALEEGAKKVQRDTLDALADEYLPAHGIYSTGLTKASVLSPERVAAEWDGSLGVVHLGFDKTKPGAGGYLITGTPKMRPDAKLEDIYSRKTYERNIRRKIEDVIKREIDSIGG